MLCLIGVLQGVGLPGGDVTIHPRCKQACSSYTTWRPEAPPVSLLMRHCDGPETWDVEGPAPTVGESRDRNIAKGVGSLTVQSALNAALGFILLGSLLRFLSPNDYAAYSGLVVSVNLVSVIASFGFNRSIVYHLATDPAEGGEGWGAARTGFTIILGLSLVASAVIAASAPFLSDYFMKSASYAWVFYLGALYLFATTISAPAQALLQGMRRYTMLAKVLLGSRSVAVAFAVTGVVLYHSLAIVVASLILNGALVVLASLPVVWAHLVRANAHGHYTKVAEYAYPLGLAAAVSAITSNTDLVIVGGYLPPSSLAIYYAAVTISSVLYMFFVTPLVTALFAETSFSSKNESQVRQGTGLALRFTLVTLLPASLMAVAMAPQLLSLFSGGGLYSQGVPYLEIIAMFYVFFAVQTVAVSILQGVGKTGDVFIVGVFTSVVELGLALSLVPDLGLLGAAVSRATVMVIGCGVSLYFVRRYLSSSVSPPFLSKALLSAALPGAVIYSLTSLVSSRVATVVPYALLGVVLFVMIARIVGLFSAEDTSYLAHTLPSDLKWIVRLIGSE